MPKTLKTTNLSPALLGNPQVQTVSNLASSVIAAMNPTSLSSTVAASAVPLANVVLSSPTSVTANISSATSTGAAAAITAAVTAPASLELIASSVASGIPMVVTATPSSPGLLQSSFSLDISPADINALSNVASSIPIKKFEPYELLSGISHERPEIVMLTNFLPLFNREAEGAYEASTLDDDVYDLMTAAGLFMNVQINTRTLRAENVSSIIRTLSEMSMHNGNLIKGRQETFKSAISQLRNDALFLLFVAKSNRALRQSLDVRNSSHEVNTEACLNDVIASFGRYFTGPMTLALRDYASKYIPKKYTLGDVLVLHGYNALSVRNKFLSTKLWLQLLQECRELVKRHSLQFIGAETNAQGNDDNSTVITKDSAVRFWFGQQPPAVKTIKQIGSTLSQNTTSQTVTVNSIVKEVETAWRALYQDVFFSSNETRTSALINVLSKEYRYSYGLSNNDVQRSLSDYYGLQLQQTNNVGVFDAVFGAIGGSIFDVRARANSLAGISQRIVDDNSAVLTFETQYVDSHAGTFTPGGEYFVDDMVRFVGNESNTARIDLAIKTFDDAYKNFGTIVAGMNVLGMGSPPDIDNASATQLINNPPLFVSVLLQKLINVQTGITLNDVNNDNMCSVYSYAVKDVRMKTLLFLITSIKVLSRSADLTSLFGFVFSSAVLDVLCNEFDEMLWNSIEALMQKSPETQDGVLPNALTSVATNPDVTILHRSIIKDALKSSSTIVDFVEGTMLSIYGRFSKDNKTMSNDKTRYGGYTDTHMMMLTFDIILSLIEKYSNQSIVSYSQGTIGFGYSTAQHYNVAHTNVNNLSSAREMVSILESELGITHQTVYSLLNMIKSVSSKFTNYRTMMSVNVYVNKMREISSIIGDDDWFRILMNEQQMWLISSLIEDLHDKVNSTSIKYDANSDGEASTDELHVLLDDSIISKNMKNAIFGALSSNDYASRKGYNKKILTVGIPLGFVQHLKQKFNIADVDDVSTLNKQSDIVNVVVYKVDIQHDDIVYKPLKFLFELSRFSVRNDTAYLEMPSGPTLDDVINSIPTRDYGTMTYNTVTYAAGGPQVARGVDVTFNDQSYSFLSNAEKRQLLRNHTLSLVLEHYIRIMTGASVGEHHFNIVDHEMVLDPSMLSMMVDGFMQTLNDVVAPSSVVDSGIGKLFSFMPSAKKSTASLSATQSSVSDQLQQRISGNAAVKNCSSSNVPLALLGLSTINGLSKTMSSVSEPMMAKRRMLSPKMFDRVLNIIIDPDDFEIDYKNTVKTPQGKQALEQLIKKGDVVHITSTQTTALESGTAGRNGTIDLNVLANRQLLMNTIDLGVGSFKLRDRDKGSSDAAFERYFVTIETYGEEVV